MLKIMKASAGSGKTYTLARTYISLLLKQEDRYAYRHILAVTFTNKATEEMKSRILKELFVLSQDPRRSGYFADFVPSLFADEEALRQKAGRVLRDILHDYTAFAVSTIDKFFQQTLKAFSREVGQFASYQVELDRKSLVAESVDRILDSLTEDDHNLLKWLTDNVLEQIEQGGRYSTDANLMEMALRLKSPQRQEAMERMGLDDKEAFSMEKLLKIREVCREIIVSFRTSVKEAAQAALDVLTEAGIRPEDSNRGFMKALYNYAALKDNDDPQPPTSSFMSKAQDSDQWFAKSKIKTHRDKVSGLLDAPLNDFCALWSAEYKVYSTACILDGQIYGLGVAGELNRTFNELMKEKNVLCIDDSNSILKGIIDGSDAPFVYEKTGVRYDHFLLDEFQDTASVQWANFSPLVHNSDSQGGESLIVGDVKQSIYRWRGSDWKLLDCVVPDEFPGHKEEVLDTNYRSLANIVNFNNACFVAAAEVLDAMNGAGEDGPLSRIYADVQQKVARKGAQSGSVSVSFCAKDNELQTVLDSVNEAREAGASLSDIVVLVRSNAIGESVATFLIDNGITVITDDSLKVRSSVTVRRLVSLLSYIDNPEDTVNSFLADSMEIEVPKGCTSLVDMAETLLRSIKETDANETWKGEVLHIQSFMDGLQDFVAASGNNLRGFLKHWETDDSSISSPSAGESVRVMTIHKSKGLDFPYVIIPFAENIKLYKADSCWCAPDLKSTPLEDVAEGVYDVLLSKSSEATLFSEHYKAENFLQQVDNINTLYVAMTRASLGMHIIAQTPSTKCLTAVQDGDLTQFADFSQILYWLVSASGRLEDVRRSGDEGVIRFDYGEMVDFNAFRNTDKSTFMQFPVQPGNECPSYPLDGRLRFSADSLDFFDADGNVGINASNRIKGVVLHDILAQIRVVSDLNKAVKASAAAGEVTEDEAAEIRTFLSERLLQAEKLGWFPEKPEAVYNEISLIDTDGEIYRPDRVVVNDGKVIIIDYKFGEHYRKYERQMVKYAGIWKRMGYTSVEAYLWYVHTGEIKNVK